MGFPPLLWEAINVFVSTLGACLLLIFGVYLFDEVSRHGFARHRLRGAIGVSVLMLGEVMTRGWAGLGRHIENNGGDVRWMTEIPLGYTPIAGTVVIALGLLCLIRVFSLDSWGPWGWVFCGVVSVAFTAIVVAL